MSPTPVYLGRYRLVEPIGAGAFATVWRGVDGELAVPVAVKVLAENWCLDSDIRARFLDEARLLRRIDSDRVVRVHDVGEADGRPYFVMDLITGGTLADVPEAASPVERLRLAAGAARAVHELHLAGVAHRDLKPENLLVDRSGDGAALRVLVADLGTAKLLADASGITRGAGTPAYMAPEQAAGAPVTARCDVYSVAVVAYELLSGRLPFAPAVPRAAWEAPAPVARSLGLPPALDDALAAALSVDPARRPQDAGELGELLDDVAAGRPSRLPGARRRRWRREWPARWVATAAIADFAAAFGVAWWWVGR